MESAREEPFVETVTCLDEEQVNGCDGSLKTSEVIDFAPRSAKG